MSNAPKARPYYDPNYPSVAFRAAGKTGRMVPISETYQLDGNQTLTVRFYNSSDLDDLSEIYQRVIAQQYAH